MSIIHADNARLQAQLESLQEKSTHHIAVQEREIEEESIKKAKTLVMPDKLIPGKGQSRRQSVVGSNHLISHYLMDLLSQVIAESQHFYEY